MRFFFFFGVFMVCMHNTCFSEANKVLIQLHAALLTKIWIKQKEFTSKIIYQHPLTTSKYKIKQILIKQQYCQKKALTANYL